MSKERSDAAKRPLNRMVSRQRPTAIEFAWTDPWTGEFCAGAYMPYTRERVVSGFYRRQIVAMKPLAKTWTGPRAPKLIVVVHRDG
jgi:hypothetical protein